MNCSYAVVVEFVDVGCYKLLAWLGLFEAGLTGELFAVVGDVYLKKFS